MSSIYYISFFSQLYRKKNIGVKNTDVQYVALIVETNNLKTASTAGNDDPMKSASAPFNGNKEIKV